MSWTYEPELLDEPKNRVRFQIGDTNERDQLVSDEEINLALEMTGSADAATAAIAKAIAAKLARQSDKWVGDLKILASQKHRAFLTIAEQYGRKGYPTAGGVYQGDKDTLAANTEVTPPSFFRGMHDFGDI